MLHFLRDLFDPLFDLLAYALTTFHGWGAPWWLSVVMLTVVVRACLFPLTVRQVRSMRRLQELKPEIEELRKEHKDEPQKLQQEMMKLYSERGANPLGSFLPALVQLPIFLVLYYTIRQFDKLESFRTGGLFWFPDLTVADPLFILPALYVGTMMISQEIASKNTAPEQRRIMRFLPIVFGVVLSRFPAGLFVYWVTSNTISIVQNLIVYRDVPKAEPKAVPETAAEKAPEAPAPVRDDDADRTKEPVAARSGSGARGNGRPSTNRKRRKKKARKR